MQNVSSIEFHAGSKEERLSGFMPDFPYTASCVDLDKYMGRFCPWHWHKAVEIFYMKDGALEYHTPEGKAVFYAGSGGMVNSNVLHMTRAYSRERKNIQMLHIFEPSFIAGEQGGRIEQRYVMPITAASKPELIPLYPDDPKQAEVLALIRNSFEISEQEPGYEIRLREALSEIWLRLFELSQPLPDEKKNQGKSNDKIKSMMIYVHEHYAEKISVAEMAAAAFSSERECFRAFHDCLHMTPVEYIQSYRMQMACRMLSDGQESLTFISHACGLGSSSYFGKIFRRHMGCTPLEYRRKWQNSDIKWQK